MEQGFKKERCTVDMARKCKRYDALQREIKMPCKGNIINPNRRYKLK